MTRAFSGRAGRSLATTYVEAAMSPGAPPPAPCPVQRGLTDPMRAAGARDGDVNRIYAWAGQAARLATRQPAAEILTRIWEDACALLG